MLLRNLLADRFKLVAHREKREGRGYALRGPARGHRLRESSGPRTFLTGRPGLIAGNGRSIGDPLPILARMVSAPVVDVSIFTAVQEQLGLRLEPIKAMVDGVVVDGVEQTPRSDWRAA